MIFSEINCRPYVDLNGMHNEAGRVVNGSLSTTIISQIVRLCPVMSKFALEIAYQLLDTPLFYSSYLEHPLFYNSIITELTSI